MLKERTKKWIPLVALLLLVASLFCLSASAATTLTLLDGGLTITDSVGTGKVSDGNVTITAKGGLLSGTTNNITMVNETDATVTLSFDYTIENAQTHTLPANNGTYSEILGAGEQSSFSITSGAWGRTATLTISNISLTKAAEASDVTFNFDSSLGSVTVAGSAVSDGESVSIPLSGTALVATAKTGSTFLGWIDGDNKRLSTATTYTLTPAEDMSLTAVFANTSTAWFLAGGDHLYDDLNDAADYAVTAGTKTVVLLNSGTLVAGTYTIPSGVTLLIPFDDSHTLYTTAPGKLETYTEPEAYRTLTMAKGAEIVVNGALSVSGKQSAKFGNNGLVTGPVGFIKMQEGSLISVENGGFLYVWGYITGSGEVIAKSGATVYEDFQFEDWRGGDQATSMKNEVFPISQFYIQNIEVPLTLEAGAKEYGYASVKVTLLGVMGADPFLFGDSDALFSISDGSVTKRYDGTTDRLIIDVNGSVTLGTLEMTLGIYGINSKKYDLMLNGNISINVHEGSTVTIAADVAFIPGVELTVDEGSTVSIAKGKNIYIYDADTWGTYCSSGNNKFMPLEYVPGRTYDRKESDLKDVSILVNGSVDASEACVYTTKGGANIHSNGTGQIKLNAGTQTVTYQVIQAADPDNSTYVEIPITPAQLKNSDGSFVATGDFGNGTYTYIGGYWHLGEDHTYNWESVLNDTETKRINHLCCEFCTDLLAKVDLQYRLDDYIWMNAIVTLESGVTGVITPASGIELVDLENGTYYLVRKVVAKELTTDFTATLTIDNVPYSLNLGFVYFAETLPDGHKHEGLVEKMIAYGEAAAIYFDEEERKNYDGNVPDAIDMSEAKDVTMGFTAGAESGVTGASLQTKSAKVYFDEALRMSVFFTPTGIDPANVVKIGLLASPGIHTDTGTLTVAKHETMYVLYSKTTPEIPGGSENYPDAEIKDKVNGTVTGYGNCPELNGKLEVCFDLTNEMYGQFYEFRPFVLLDDGSCVYGDQVHYSLAAYISRTYTKSTDNAFKNLLVATWDYVVAADAAFEGSNHE